MPKIKMIKEEMITPTVTPQTTETSKKTKPKATVKKVDRRHDNPGRPSYEELGIAKKGTKLSIYVPEEIKKELTKLFLYKGKKSANELINDYLVTEIKKMNKKGKATAESEGGRGNEKD